MANIVAGRFEQQTDADAAIAELMRLGFARDQVTSFFVNPPGEHAKFLIGGDREASPGAESAGTGAVAGAAVGGAVGASLGLAATPVMGPAAPPGAEVGGPLAGDARPQRIRK
jgi:hypothetical protein